MKPHPLLSSSLGSVMIVALAALLGLAAPARSQTVEEAVEPQRVEAPLPWRFTADERGVESVFDHAANLGFQEGLEFGTATGLSLDGAWQPDRLLVGTSVRLGALGLGIGAVRPMDGDGFERVDTSMALRLGGSLSLGFRTERLEHEIEGGTEGEEQETERFAVSTTWRPSRAFSLALSVDDLDEDGGDSASVLRAALAVRPGTERLVFGAEAAQGPSSWLAGGALRFMATPGLELGAYGRFVQHEEHSERIEWGAFLAVHQGRLSLESSVDRVDPSGDPDASGMGGVQFLRIASRRSPRLVAPPGRVVRLAIDGPAPERPRSGFFTARTPGWAERLLRLNAIAQDPGVDGLHLDLHRAPGWGQAWELRRTLARLKAAGKHVSVRVGWADMRSISGWVSWP